MDGDTLKMRVQGIEALDRVAASVQRGLKVVLDSDAVLRSKSWKADILGALVATPAGSKGGDIRIVLPLGDRGREVEIAVPGSFDVSPRQVGLLSTVPGVIEVQEVLKG